MRKPRKTNDEVAAELAAVVIQAITSGTAGKWTCPWDALAIAGLPRNGVTNRPYNGINLLILGLDERAIATGDPQWMTYKLADGEGWQVRKGEKSTKILLAKEITVNDDEDQEDGTKQVLMFRTFSVFHASQIDGVPTWEAPSITRSAPERHAQAEALISASGAKIGHDGTKAFYNPTTDTITLPAREAFRTQDGYYSTVLHELAHWTKGGTPPRVERGCPTIGPFGSEPYAREEVRAELGAALMMAELGLRDPAEATECQAYIASWIRGLHDDPREVIAAMRDAQAIAGHLLSYQHDDILISA